MDWRIHLDESAESAPGVPQLEPVGRVPPPSRQVALADWDRPSRSILKLYLEDEPEINQVFCYNGLEWQIVEYRDGWIARLIVE
jgi:hypothetical protein